MHFLLPSLLHVCQYVWDTHGIYDFEEICSQMQQEIVNQRGWKKVANYENNLWEAIVLGKIDLQRFIAKVTRIKVEEKEEIEQKSEDQEGGVCIWIEKGYSKEVQKGSYYSH